MKRIRYYFMKAVLYPVFYFWLKWLIENNYRMRVISAICREAGIPPCTPDGIDYPDEWFWADKLCSRYGYFVSYNAARDSKITRYILRIGGLTMYQIYKDHDGITKGIIDTVNNVKIEIKGQFRSNKEKLAYAEWLGNMLWLNAELGEKFENYKKEQRID